MICVSGSLYIPSIVFLVVPATFDVMANLAFTIEFNRVLLPVFGLPMMLTKPLLTYITFLSNVFICILYIFSIIGFKREVNHSLWQTFVQIKTCEVVFLRKFFVFIVSFRMFLSHSIAPYMVKWHRSFDWPVCKLYRRPKPHSRFLLRTFLRLSYCKNFR